MHGKSATKVSLIHITDLRTDISTRVLIIAYLSLYFIVGGIYTVIRSKTFVSMEEMGDQYFLLGPYKEQCARQEVELGELPATNPIQIATNKMRERGLGVKLGRWLVDGNPQVVLFDLGACSWKLNDWKQELWDKTGIGIPHPDVECNDSVLFGYAAAQFIADFRQATAEVGVQEPKIVAHFHEWLAGIGLIMLRLWGVDVATVFTTHATLLGRFLCAGMYTFLLCVALAGAQM